MRRLIALLLLALPVAAPAQFYSYPSFQPPRITLREYNFAFADGHDGGTTLLFQWREGMNERMHVQLDVGFADPSVANADARFVIGGTVARGLKLATDEMPLDMAITGGIGGSFGGGESFLRLPVGLTVGHRFKLDSPFTLTPYAHPRLTLDFCSHCGPARRHDTTLGVDVDLGVSAELSNSFGLRASYLFGGSDFFGKGNAFGASVVWTPLGLSK